MKKNFILGAFIVSILSYGVVITPQTVEAACSYNGYLHSGGKCGQSFKWEKKEWKNKFEDHEDDDDDEDEREYKWKDKKYYSYNHGYSYDEDYLRSYINRLLALLAILEDGDNDDDSSNDIDVETLAATSIDEDGATLRAKIFLDDEDEGELYFQYGTTARNLSRTTAREDIDENDDGDIIEIDVNDLDEDTKYFFRAVVVDEDGNKDYGTILSFFTDEDDSDDDDDNDDESPSVTTSAERNVDNDSADLRGTVDMNDFENGVAFLVFGEDEDKVEDVEDDFDTYDDVDTEGDDLRKSLVDSDVDEIETYTQNVSDLDENTEIFFALCVAYEDEDDDDTLECGNTRSFETE